MTRFVSRISLTTLFSLLGTMLLLTLAAPRLAYADNQQATAKLGQRVLASNEVLKDLQRIPEQAIPPNLLNRAYAIAVLPNVVKGAFLVGGSFGSGVLMVRNDDGSWSNPAFIKLSNLSVGPQLGVQGADLVMVFRSRRSVDDIARGRFTLGGSASASAGPVGRTALAMTDGTFKSEIYTYARSRGMFLGVAMDGAVITMDELANARWYGNTTDGNAARIFSDPAIATPPGTQPLLDTLSAMAPQVNWKATAQASTTPATSVPAGTETTESKTYAVEDGVEPAPETKF